MCLIEKNVFSSTSSSFTRLLCPHFFSPQALTIVPTKSPCHRITEWFGSQGTFEDHLLQLPHAPSWAGTFFAISGAQSPMLRAKSRCRSLREGALQSVSESFGFIASLALAQGQPRDTNASKNGDLTESFLGVKLKGKHHRGG